MGKLVREGVYFLCYTLGEFICLLCILFPVVPSRVHDTSTCCGYWHRTSHQSPLWWRKNQKAGSVPYVGLSTAVCPEEPCILMACWCLTGNIWRRRRQTMQYCCTDSHTLLVVCRYTDLHKCRAAHRVKRQDSFLLRYRHLDFECALGRVYKFNMACWPSVNTNHAIHTHLRDYKRGSVDKIQDVFSEEDEL